MHTNHLNKTPTGDGNPTAGQHTKEAEISPRLPTMASCSPLYRSEAIPLWCQKGKVA
jgi:hypothetical protein